MVNEGIGGEGRKEKCRADVKGGYRKKGGTNGDKCMKGHNREKNHRERSYRCIRSKKMNHEG